MLSVLRLFRGLDAARVEAISHRAVEVGVLTYASVASIIKHRLDQSRRRKPRTPRPCCTKTSAKIRREASGKRGHRALPL
jgi:hypothetical protein